MATSPLINAKDLVTFKVLSAGKVIKDTYQVFKITVDNAINRIPAAVIKLQDSDVAEKDFTASDSIDFIPGTEIEIQAGYDGDEETIFKGIVVSIRIVLDADQGSVLEVSCRDKAILMTNTRNTAYYTDAKDANVITTIINKYKGLSADVKSTSYKHECLVQYDATDWDFMMIRADVNGLLTTVQNGKLSVKPPNTKSSPVLTLTYGSDLIEFEADLNALGQLPSVEAVSWDAASQAVESQSAKEPSVTSIGNLSGKKLCQGLGIDEDILRTSAQVNSQLLQSWADARLLKSRMSSLTGSATFLGSALVSPNTVVELKGVGNRFSGDAFVSSLSHVIFEGKWTTEIRFGLRDEWFAEKPNINSMPASGISPGIGGLMVAKVKQLDKDPEKESRILVKLPLMQDDNQGVWARLNSYYATENRGSFFIPEVDDEVIVGFLNSDPNYPVILGSLYSSKNPPPYDITEDNYTKAIVTKGENKVEFDDDKKIIKVQTPGNNQVVISDEDKGITLKDQNGNTIITDTSGITLKDKSGNKILMSASGIEISSSSNLKLKAAADITVSGNNITNSANITMKSTGQASAEFSASGQTTIKGAMVMIN